MIWIKNLFLLVVLLLLAEVHADHHLEQEGIAGGEDLDPFYLFVDSEYRLLRDKRSIGPTERSEDEGSADLSPGQPDVSPWEDPFSSGFLPENPLNRIPRRRKNGRRNGKGKGKGGKRGKKRGKETGNNVKEHDEDEIVQSASQQNVKVIVNGEKKKKGKGKGKRNTKSSEQIRRNENDLIKNVQDEQNIILPTIEQIKSNKEMKNEGKRKRKKKTKKIGNEQAESRFEQAQKDNNVQEEQNIIPPIIEQTISNEIDAVNEKDASLQNQGKNKKNKGKGKPKGKMEVPETKTYQGQVSTEQAEINDFNDPNNEVKVDQNAMPPQQDNESDNWARDDKKAQVSDDKIKNGGKEKKEENRNVKENIEENIVEDQNNDANFFKTANIAMNTENENDDEKETKKKNDDEVNDQEENEVKQENDKYKEGEKKEYTEEEIRNFKQWNRGAHVSDLYRKTDFSYDAMIGKMSMFVENLSVENGAEQQLMGRFMLRAFGGNMNSMKELAYSNIVEIVQNTVKKLAEEAAEAAEAALDKSCSIEDENCEYSDEEEDYDEDD